MGVRVRNLLYDLGILGEKSAGVPVVAVGNLTAGGTGKTPVVEHLAAYLLGQGKRTGIISRGYGRRSKGLRVVADGSRVRLTAEQGGDEPVQMARAFPGATVIVSERRIPAARRAVQEFGVEVLLLDDAFQHRAIRRDLNIVVVDASRSVVEEPLLPVGMRREPLCALRRADVLVFTNVDARTRRVQWEESVRPWFGGEIVYGVRGHQAVLDVRNGTTLPPESLRGRACCVVSGIGNPGQFVEGLRALKADIRAELRFPDHHWYSDGDIRSAMAEAARAGADTFVTTMKDLMRLELQPRFATVMERMTVLVPKLTLDFFPQGKLEQLVDRAIGSAA